MHKSNSLKNNTISNIQYRGKDAADNIPTRIINDINLSLNEDVDLKYFPVWKFISVECRGTKFLEKLREIYTCAYAIRMLHFAICRKMAHYTKIENITSFFNLNDSNYDVGSASSNSSTLPNNDSYLKYRAYNSDCLKNPSEGDRFRDILVNQLRSDGAKCDLFQKYWGELYGSSSELKESKTYLLSFTDVSAHDMLPVRSPNGDDGTGCCISFKNNLLITEPDLVQEEEISPDFNKLSPAFNKSSSDFNKTALKFSEISPQFSEMAPKFDKIVPEFDEIYNFMNHPYALSVFYHSSDECMKGEYFYNKLCEHILKLEKEIQKTKLDLVVRKNRVETNLEANIELNLENLDSENLDLENEHFEILTLQKRIRKINPLVKIILDQIRFLYKDKSHEHEHELRIVRFVDTLRDDIKLGNPKNIGDIPSLYVDINTNIRYKDVSISLGPKVDNPHKITSYLKHTGVSEVKLSKNNLQ